MSDLNTNQITSSDLNRQSNLEKGFKPFKKVNDLRHGQLTIVQNPETQERLAVKESIFTGERELKDEIAAVKKRLTLSNHNLMSVKDFSAGKKSEFCSTHYWLRTFFEYPMTDAKFQAQVLKKEGKSYSHQALTHMLYNTVDAGAHLQQNGLSHGNISPVNIAIEGDHHYKLMENFSNIKNPQSAQEERILAGRSHYTSPEKYQNVIRGRLNQPIDTAKNDVFGLGLSILEVGNAKTVKGIYNKNGSINEDILRDLESQFSAKHGHENNLLVSTVRSMVELDHNDRPDFIEIQQQLPPYEEVKNFLGDQVQEDDVNLQENLSLNNDDRNVSLGNNFQPEARTITTINTTPQTFTSPNNNNPEYNSKNQNSVSQNVNGRNITYGEPKLIHQTPRTVTSGTYTTTYPNQYTSGTKFATRVVTAPSNTILRNQPTTTYTSPSQAYTRVGTTTQPISISNTRSTYQPTRVYQSGITGETRTSTIPRTTVYASPSRVGTTTTTSNYGNYPRTVVRTGNNPVRSSRIITGGTSSYVGQRAPIIRSSYRQI